jgi:hypothetical protein
MGNKNTLSNTKEFDFDKPSPKTQEFKKENPNNLP